MKKYLLIVKRKNVVAYLVYSSYADLMKKVELLHATYCNDIFTTWYRIDKNCDSRIFKISCSLYDLIFDNLEVYYD